jgi:TonB family protein
VPLAMLRGFAENLARKQLAKQQPGADAATIAKVSQAAYDGTLRSAVASGYMRVEGDMLVTSIDIRDGVVLVNGKPLQMPKPQPPVAAVGSGAGSMRARRIAEKCILPDYPGDVVAQDRALSLALQLTVEEDGSVDKLAIARSSGLPAYDAAVLAAAAHCTYIPALRNGKPVAVSEVWEIVRTPGTAHP